MGSDDRPLHVRTRSSACGNHVRGAAGRPPPADRSKAERRRCPLPRSTIYTAGADALQLARQPGAENYLRPVSHGKARRVTTAHAHAANLTVVPRRRPRLGLCGITAGVIAIIGDCPRPPGWVTGACPPGTATNRTKTGMRTTDKDERCGEFRRPARQAENRPGESFSLDTRGLMGDPLSLPVSLFPSLSRYAVKPDSRALEQGQHREYQAGHRHKHAERRELVAK
jgi:hypothetical protein